MEEKTLIRKKLLAHRAGLSPQVVSERSEKMCQVFLQWIGGREFSKIFLFHPFRNEPDLTPLVDKLGTVIAMPIVVSRSEMIFYKVDSATKYLSNRWGILEPRIDSGQSPEKPDRNSLIVIPALAADRTGHRLGYGGGFYDRFLLNAGAQNMVAVFDEFIVPQLPAADHDVRMNFILSESGVGEC